MYLFFKIYFGIMVLVFIGVYFLLIVDQEPYTFSDVIDSVICLVSMVGIYGFAFRKKIFSAGFWKIFFPIFVIWEVAYIAMISVEDPSIFSNEYGMFFILLFLAIALVIMVPAYVAIYLYGRRFGT